ncbi:hypothetical protein R3P38DRAFT_3366712 [Favolaschia claudopus]|uniref:Uncharacterized protein n=1 Tax=Favolaschia claudopus TaxID=2862362 RepID=A0AAW0AEI9_9AGAR
MDTFFRAHFPDLFIYLDRHFTLGLNADPRHWSLLIRSGSTLTVSPNSPDGTETKRYLAQKPDDRKIFLETHWDNEDGWHMDVEPHVELSADSGSESDIFSMDETEESDTSWHGSSPKGLSEKARGKQPAQPRWTPASHGQPTPAAPPSRARSVLLTASRAQSVLPIDITDEDDEEEEFPPMPPFTQAGSAVNTTTPMQPPPAPSTTRSSARMTPYSPYTTYTSRHFLPLTWTERGWLEVNHDLWTRPFTDDDSDTE